MMVCRNFSFVLVYALNFKNLSCINFLTFCMSAQSVIVGGAHLQLELLPATTLPISSNPVAAVLVAPPLNDPRLQPEVLTATIFPISSNPVAGGLNIHHQTTKGQLGGPNGLLGCCHHSMPAAEDGHLLHRHLIVHLEKEPNWL